MISYSVENNWPLEYQHDGQHFGLSRDFLNLIAQQTGLQFVYQPPSAVSPPMLISAVTRSLLTPSEQQRGLFTSPWIASIPMIIGLKQTTGIRSLEQLQGKTVTVTAGSPYAAWLHGHYPAIRVLEKSDVRAALDAVAAKESDAALGSGLVMLPVFQRVYFDTMAVAAQIPEMASGISMEISPAYPELQVIINQALENITAGDVQTAYEQWAGILEFGTPSAGVIWAHYRWQIVLTALFLLLLAAALRSAILATRRARRSEQQQASFLAMMSHEIRTPMNAMMAALDLLRGTSENRKRHEYTELAYSSSQHLLDLLNDVLDHSRLSQRRMQLEQQPFSLQKMLEAVCAGQQPAAQTKGLKLSLHIAEDLQNRTVLADAHRLRQIINNLLSNAIKFTDSGAVTLTASGEIHHRLLRTLTIEVQDSGIGIPDNVQQRLFAAWEQADSSSSRHYGGSGLGLYICQQLIKLMGGQITLTSTEGRGTTVGFSLPVSEATESEGEEAKVALSLPDFQQQVSLLVVEDHPANQYVLKEQLLRMACGCDIASDGPEALKFLEEENYYDLILLDCNLPGYDGYQLAKFIRQFEAQHQRTRTPIVAISALNTATHFQRCRDSDMDGILTKPVSIQKLATTLCQWCEVPGQTQRSDVNLSVAIPDDLWLWLNEDQQAFCQAQQQGDTQGMIYSIHRIRGVAQMYRFSVLADFAQVEEGRLRSGLSPDRECADRLAQFIHQAQQNTPPAETP
ncbi:ATP-binding protein [Buttiauxella gaviniae]|uniref:ATP-binding protein n=1 Tax=Buttiauxella gaviniae TaxID=82990 RepID=UPI003976DFBA